MLSIQQIIDGVNTVAGEYPITKVELFGSYAEGRNRQSSDVDLLVEFSSPRISLITLNGLKCRLEEILETDVDVIHGPLPDGAMLEINRRIPIYGA